MACCYVYGVTLKFHSFIHSFIQYCIIYGLTDSGRDCTPSVVSNEQTVSVPVQPSYTSLSMNYADALQPCTTTFRSNGSHTSDVDLVHSIFCSQQ